MKSSDNGQIDASDNYQVASVHIIRASV